MPHITLKSIANNAEIDVIWERYQEKLEPLRTRLNAALGRTAPPSSPGSTGRSSGGAGDAALDAPVKPGHDGGALGHDGGEAPWEEWEIPREAGQGWPAEARDSHAQWWEARIARQKEIDASIAAKADFEYLYDKPYTDKSKIRVAGPFTVESLSPHRTLVVDQDDNLVDTLEAAEGTDDADLEEVYNTERHLLYVACTRARDFLWVSGVEPASEFLDDLTGPKSNV